ncbi:hypothetical protein SLS62_005470 [Diatrype stigma]|uniref:Aminoglycoside phosphotransferase domain-containing protein n=1 Tax=Diatrype stigma TaxID=117547 RepID=A0AAN9USX2_9PEZI
MPSFIPRDILSPLIGEEYVSQARRERRFELAAWENRNRNEKDKPWDDDLAFILGLSWRFHSLTSDVDLVGGFDARRLLKLGGALKHLRTFLAHGRVALVSWVADGSNRMLGLLKNAWRNTDSVPVSDEMKETKIQTLSPHPLEEWKERKMRRTEKAKKGGKENKFKQKKRKPTVLPSLRDALHDVLPSHSRIPSSGDHGGPSSDREERRKRHHDFAAILAQVDRDAIAALCLQVFEERRGGPGSPPLAAPLLEVEDPILGAAHVLWPVRICTESNRNNETAATTRWIVKVPVAGTPDTWDELGADALRGEALTLRMLGTLGLGDGDDSDDDNNSDNKEKKPTKTRRRGRGRRFPAPLPIQADPGAHNTIHAPYLIMEFVEGVRLDEYWFAGTGTGTGSRDRREMGKATMSTTTSYSAEHIRLRRRRVLESLARAMLRLSAAGAMRQGGAPVVDEAAADWRLLTQIAAPARHLDVQAMLGRWFARGGGGNVHFDGGGNDEDIRDGDRGDDDVRVDVDEGYESDDDDEESDGSGIERTPLYTAVWPHDEPRDAYTALLDRYPPETEAAAGVDALLRLLIGMIREPRYADADAASPSSNQHNDKGGGEGESEGHSHQEDETQPFVLAHPDLQLRHVLVCRETGEVRGLVGWDGVRAVPRSLGNEALPRWLVRDFNPFSYGWTPEVLASSVGGRVVITSGGDGGLRLPQLQQATTVVVHPEDPPWMLAELRSMYADIIQGLKRDGQSQKSAGRANIKTNSLALDVNIARQSLLALTVDAAVRDPRCRAAVLRRLLQKCSRQFEPLDYDAIVDVLGSERRLDWYTMRCLRRNVRELVERGYVRGAIVW